MIDFSAVLEQLQYDPANPLLFNSGFFVYFFFVFLAVFLAVRNNAKARVMVFTIFSLYFFYKACGKYVGLVLLSAIVDFVISNAIYRLGKVQRIGEEEEHYDVAHNKGKRKALLVLSIVLNLGMLFYFKYTNFFIGLVNDFGNGHVHPLNLLLPIGISFYTFENLSYTVDVYKGIFTPVKRFIDYLFFLSFFPKLVMGPIVRAADFIPQIYKPYSLDNRQFSRGFYLIFTGLFKKIVISDFLQTNYVYRVFEDPESLSRLTGIECLLGVYCYAMVIYCDFSGYSDVAIGLARWFGFEIPVNFDSPYQSKNITEFWRRWHISLSSWLRDYLYIPLGGNRKAVFASWLIAIVFFGSILGFSGYAAAKLHLGWPLIISVIVLLVVLLPPLLVKEKRKSVATSINQMNTMLLGGFWHGASLNFIIWGAMHGTALAFHKVWSGFAKRHQPLLENRLANIISIFITFHFVCFCWIFFKASTLSDALLIIQQIGTNFHAELASELFRGYESVIGMLVFALFLHFTPQRWATWIEEKLEPVPAWGYFILFACAMWIFVQTKTAEQVLPIYLQF